MAAGTHPFPFRTRQLSPPAPMVLGGHSPGRVGRRRILSDDARPRRRASSRSRPGSLLRRPPRQDPPWPSARPPPARRQRRRRPAPQPARSPQEAGAGPAGRAQRLAAGPRRVVRDHPRHGGSGEPGQSRARRGGTASRRRGRDDDRAPARDARRRAGTREPRRDRDRDDDEPRAAGARRKRAIAGRVAATETRRDARPAAPGTCPRRSGRARTSRGRREPDAERRSSTRPGARCAGTREPRPEPDAEAAGRCGRSRATARRRPRPKRSAPAKHEKAAKAGEDDDAAPSRAGAGVPPRRPTSSPRRGPRTRGAQDQLARAAEAFAAGRERDAARMLRPLRDAYPDGAAVRELLGLVQYRLGNYPAATKELARLRRPLGLGRAAPGPHGLLARAAALRRVETLWDELAQSSPSGALVTEGRIVLAGALRRRRAACSTRSRRSPGGPTT